MQRRIIISDSTSSENSRKKSEDKFKGQEDGLEQYPELSDLIGQTENDLGSSSDSSNKKKPIFGSRESKIKNHPFLGKYLVKRDLNDKQFSGASLKNQHKDNSNKLVLAQESDIKLLKR